MTLKTTQSLVITASIGQALANTALSRFALYLLRTSPCWWGKFPAMSVVQYPNGDYNCINRNTLTSSPLPIMPLIDMA